MGEARSFLVLEVPGLKTAGLEYSRTHSSLVIDIVVGPAQTGTGAVRAFCLARGLGPGDVAGFVASLRGDARYAETVKADAAAGVWFGVLDIEVTRLPDPAAVRMNEFLDAAGLGTRWIRIEQGVTYLRAELPDDGDPQRLLEAARRFVHESGLEGHVDLEEASRKDAGPWLELLLRSLERRNPRA